MSATRSFAFLVSSLMLLGGILAHANGPAAGTGTSSTAERVARGKYLVTIGSCHDCHTPLTLGPRGPEPDMSRELSGHPANVRIDAPAAMPAGPWMAVAANTMTAWTGPWGVSFTANLTPDEETGLGKWTEQQFIDALRTGRHQGKGRAILPPMPWSMIGKMTDEDLKAVFAYLQSIPPIRNRVPSPIDPADASVQ